ncbi:hypothetical protein CEXT_298881 [Caerostris extrusa]|uniref:Uncharacterized protein n=1 Tax=Caerostris extrusa TaxID=172846 RepID=A0AAV4MCI0_CAEEX|nr:hypothetical protein CEXT_298881 [Caerostris extrusa]
MLPLTNPPSLQQDTFFIFEQIFHRLRTLISIQSVFFLFRSSSPSPLKSESFSPPRPPPQPRTLLPPHPPQDLLIADTRILANPPPGSPF